MKNSIIQTFMYALLFPTLCGLINCYQKVENLPILILATNANFGTYTAEILKAEGFNEFVTDSFSGRRVSGEYLGQFDLVILAETNVSRLEKELLTRYVKQGGNLIAFSPDRGISELFGITPAPGSITEGYISMDTLTKQGSGITSKALQFHGTAEKYSIKSAKVIASIFEDKKAGQAFPGAVANDFGKGHTVAFLYNLPKSIVYTRQGNPLLAGIEMDGIPGLRGLDMFTDGWVDTSNNTINQADQQMALLSNCIIRMNYFTKPLPRFWYFPDTLKCLATLTNDGEFRGEADFESQFRDVDSMRAKMSLYILEVNNVSKPWVDRWTAKGFEIAGHPDDTKEAGNPEWRSMDSALNIRLNQIKSAYGLSTRTNVNHWFVWCGNDSTGKKDFGAQARLEEKKGIELDVNYAHYDINSNQGLFYLGTPGFNQGNFNGSGLVMKFADVNGKTINVYQHFNAVYDQQYNESRNPEGFYNCFKGLVDRSLNDEIYSFVSVKAHNDEYYFSKKPLMKILEYANIKGIPVWTAANLLNFLKMKDEASFTNISWENNQLSFTLNSSIKHSSGLTFMVPALYAGKKIRAVKKNSTEVAYTIKRIRGYDYAFITVKGGQDYSIKVDFGK